MTDSILLAELLEEIYQRLEVGEPVDVGQYAAQYPQLASQLQQLVPAMAVLGELSQPAADFPTSEGHQGPVTPSSLGDFQIVREIGRGGMGVVYEAEQLSLARRVVAVKILPFAALWPETALQRFRQEVRVAALLEHPHIVPVYSVGCERGVHFYVMKLINGCSLADVIQSQQAAESKPKPQANDQDRPAYRPISPAGPFCPLLPLDREPDWYRAAARLGLEAAQALAFAHQQAVIHRDIKPSNLLLDRDGHLFVADFGLARCETNVNLTRTGDLLGTPRYMSPEQAAGNSNLLDPRTDIFSLGATLYELLTFHPIIAARGRVEVIRALQQLEVIPLRTHDRNIPRPLEWIVLKCLQPNRGDRYSSATELADDLQRFLDRKPIAARPPGLSHRTSHWMRRHPRVALSVFAAIVTCLLMMSIGTWIAHHRRFASPTPRGPPTGELVTTSPSRIDSNPDQESADVLRTSGTKRSSQNPANANSSLEQFGGHLLSWWTADNTAGDTVGTNHGALNGGATYAAGQIGQAFSFDGIDDRVGVADSPSLALTQSMTIEGWIKVNAISQGILPIVFRGDDRRGLDPYQLSSVTGGNLMFQICSRDNITVLLLAPAPAGEFIHIAATLDDATGAMKIYENGTLVAQTTTSVRPFGALDPLLHSEVKIGNAFNGLIDELKIYDEALSSDQVLANYNAARGTDLPTISISDTATIEGDVHFGAGLGNLVSTEVNGGLHRSAGMEFGPDGNLYVASNLSNEVLKYNPTTGQFLGTFVTSGSGGLSLPSVGGLAFRPDGKLYVLSSGNANVLRYDAATGAFLDVFVPSGSGGLSGPKGMRFGPDGNLYISSSTNQILKYNGTSGAFLGVFAAAGSGGLSSPPSLVFGPDGNLYAASSPTRSVLRYNGATGAFIDAFIPSQSGNLWKNADMLFWNGSLYVASQGTNQILRYDATTGAFLDAVDPSNSNGIDQPIGLLLGPDGNLLVGSYGSINRYGLASGERITVKLSSPRPESISVNYTTANGTALAGSDYSSTSGTLTFAPGEIIKSFLVSTANDAVFEGNETFVVNLSNSVGATIADGQGVATIIDDEALISGESNKSALD